MISLNSKGMKKIIEGLDRSTAALALCDLYRRNVHYRYPPKPNTRQHYVGIEIECYSTLTNPETMLLLLECDLEKNVNISDDGSIDMPSGCYSYEFRVLSTEKALPTTLKKLDKFLKKGKFKANETCGLHVHLDMRHRDNDKCYDKLRRFQDLLYGMVNSKRWDNDYCQWSCEATLQRRMSAINLTALGEHDTIEIRLHHGSTDAKKIGNWVNLLVKMVNSKFPKEIESKKDALEFAGKDQKLKTYINKTFNPRWYSKKSAVLWEQADRRNAC